MKKILNSPYLNLFARIVVGAIFLIAAAGKIANPAEFAKEIGNYNIMPDYLINIFALSMPWIELVCGIFLIAGIRLRPSAAISVLLYIVFTLAILGAIIQGLNINCGCHTRIMAEKVGIQKILENLGLLIVSLYIFFFPVRKLTLENIIIKEANITT